MNLLPNQLNNVFSSRNHSSQNKTSMKNSSIFLGLVCVAFVALLSQCTQSPTTSTETPYAVKATYGGYETPEKWGEHLVTICGCHDCHSPKIITEFGPKVDSSKMLSGHPENAPYPKINLDALQPGNWIHFSPDLTTFVGPWGMSFAANLTSDSATGIGAWNESNFVNAIRKGKHMGIDSERPIMPPMPWDNYNNLSDNDLKSIFAYLQTTIPVSNRVHAPYSPDEVRTMKDKLQ